MNVLVVGDVVGPDAVDDLAERIPGLRRERPYPLVGMTWPSRSPGGFPLEHFAAKMRGEDPGVLPPFELATLGRGAAPGRGQKDRARKLAERRGDGR